MNGTRFEVCRFWLRTSSVFLLSVACLCFGIALVFTVGTIVGIPFVFLGTLLSMTSFVVLYTSCWISCPKDEDVEDEDSKANDYPPPYRLSWIGPHLDENEPGSSTEERHIVTAQPVGISQEHSDRTVSRESNGELPHSVGQSSVNQSSYSLDHISGTSSDDCATPGPSGWRPSSSEFTAGRCQESSPQTSIAPSYDSEDCKRTQDCPKKVVGWRFVENVQVIIM